MQVFEIDFHRNEPYLRLPGRHSNIIITPPRLSDAPAIVSILNDPRVYPTLEGPPYPYEVDSAIEWLSFVKSKTDEAWARIQKAPDGKFGASPVRIIRQINEDGSQTYLGDCGIDRWGFLDIECNEEREQFQTANLSRADGDGQVVWTIGGIVVSLSHSFLENDSATRLFGGQSPWNGHHECSTRMPDARVGYTMDGGAASKDNCARR